MLRDAYKLVKGTITVAPATAPAPNNFNKRVTFEGHLLTA